MELRRPALAAAGFQLSARYLHGRAAGEQAGTLESLDGRTAVEITEEGIMYASHTVAGAGPAGARDHAAGCDDSGVVEGSVAGVARWTLHWTAPADGGDVAFDLAAQVANDNDSEFGETLYTARRVVQAAPASPSADRVPAVCPPPLVSVLSSRFLVLSSHPSAAGAPRSSPIE